MEEADEPSVAESLQPIAKASVLSNFFFCWALPFFHKRYRKKNLKNEEIRYRPLNEQKATELGDKLEEEWMKELNKTKPSLWMAICRTFRWEFLKDLIMYLLIEFILKPSQPLYINKLLQAMTSRNGTKLPSDHPSVTNRQEIYFYSCLILLTHISNVLVAHRYYFAIQHLGMKVRIACCSVIYRKILRISLKTMDETGVGKLMNLMSNDVNCFDMAAMHFVQFLVAPVEALLLFTLMLYTVGWTASPGIGLLFVFLPCQMFLGRKTSDFKLSVATKTDNRVKLMNEIIAGIQVIKMYAWEEIFINIVERARRLEVSQIKLLSYLRAITVSFVIFLNRTGIFLCILSYVLYWDKIDAQHVFTVTAFYSILRQTLTVHIPSGFNNYNETKVSIERIRSFLLSQEIDCRQSVTYVGTTNGQIDQPLIKSEKPTANYVSNNNPEIRLQNATLKYDQSAMNCVLHDINFEVKSGKLVAIFGEVGSGKTSLLKAILKEVPVCQGTVQVKGSISYAAQEPWLFSSTIRQNILFGRKMDVDRYKKVIEVTCLEHDLKLLPNGDKSEVGERGVLLSGGQRARINLARAIYKKADVYLFDDPLSAVDAHVAREIFDKCFKEFLRDKCVVLVTHQFQYLDPKDQVYLMSQGTIECLVTAKDLLEKNITEVCTVNQGDDFVNTRNLEHINGDLHKNNYVKDSNSKKFKEQKQTGRISTGVYRQYLGAGGSLAVILTIAVMFLSAQVGASGFDYFPAFWMKLEEVGYRLFSVETCTYIYILLITFTIAVTITRSIMFFKFCLNAGTNLHHKMLTRVVQAPMGFFKTNSSGVILNRFSKDLGLIDDILPTVAMDTIQIAFIILGLVVVVTIVNVWMLIPGIVILVISYYLRIVFVTSSRDLKREEALARSPVYSHITSALQGLSTIRAFDAQDSLRTEFDHHLDHHTSVSYLFLACNRAFGFWLDMFYISFVSAIIGGVMLRETYAGNVGLSITQAISLTGVFQWGMRQWSQLENQMTSVERVVEYTDIQSEIDDYAAHPVEGWPENGTISFDSVSLRYSLDDPLVLDDITFSVSSREKIGIVGRTGAGKSSLISAMLRLTTIKGDVIIDGANIRNIPLKILRSKISVIPQEPILFSGSLRNNLDPFQTYDDGVLWNALEQVEMKNLVASSPEGLQLKVQGGGSNFSVGQRQLLCLARAILRNNKILILDEATANVDLQTDLLIQNTIKEQFRECTVLTVAHRLNTVIDCDRILVLDDGRLVEFDHPYLLLKKSGIFCDMARQLGSDIFENLLEIAKKNYNSIIT